MNDQEEFSKSFNYPFFITWLKNHNVFAVAIAAVLSFRINDITTTFIETMIMPLINRDGDGDGKADIKKIEDITTTINGVKFQTGKFIVSFIKFLLVLFVVYIIYLSFNKSSLSNTSNITNTVNSK